MDDFDLDWFLDVAEGLLAIPSTADRPAELHRAREFVLDFVPFSGSNRAASPAPWSTGAGQR